MATSIQNKTASDLLISFADEAEANKATYEPVLVNGLEHFVHSVFSTLDQGVPFHGGLLKFVGDNARAALERADLNLEAQIQSGADGAYERGIAAIRAEAARLAAL